MRKLFKKSKESNPVQPAYRSLDRINISLGKKFNLGNYESVDIHASYSTDLEPGKTRMEALDECYLIVKEELVKVANDLGIHINIKDPLKIKKLVEKEEE